MSCLFSVLIRWPCLGFRVSWGTCPVPNWKNWRFENELVSEIQSAYGEQGVTLPKSGRVSDGFCISAVSERTEKTNNHWTCYCTPLYSSNSIQRTFGPELHTVLDAKVGISSKHIEAWTFFEETAFCLNSIHVMMRRKKSFCLPVFCVDCVGTIHDRWWCAGWRKHGRKGNRWKSFVPNLMALKITTKKQASVRSDISVVQGKVPNSQGHQRVATWHNAAIRAVGSALRTSAQWRGPCQVQT